MRQVFGGLAYVAHIGSMDLDVQIESRAITTEADYVAFCEALKTAGLPYQDLDYKNHHLVGYFAEGDMIGTGALEIYSPYALLRSLSVRDVNRGQALGSRITDDLLTAARQRNIKAIYLLTEGAKLFFKRKGFKEIDRASAPDQVCASSEFSSVCPESAVCMEFIVTRV